jgi:ribosome biogenesis GTPase A
MDSSTGTLAGGKEDLKKLEEKLRDEIREGRINWISCSFNSAGRDNNEEIMS